MVKVVNTINAPAAIGPYTQAIKAQGFIFVSGQLPVNPQTGTMETSIEKQTEQSLKNIQMILEAAHSSMDKIVKTTIFIKNMKDFSAVNEVYSAFWGGQYPARSCIEVSALPKDAQVEIEAIAIE